MGFITVGGDGSTGRGGYARGFSLLELMLAVCLLMVVTGAIFEQLIAMQRKSVAEAARVDVTQQAREFVDGMVRDLHMTGYPKISMYSVALDNTSPQVAAGIVSVSPANMIYEGDVNSQGVVYSVNVQYLANDPNDPNCPCVRRSALPKVAGSPLAQPVSPLYTQIDRVVPPGVGPGLAGEDLFTFYDVNGNKIDVSAGVNIATPAPAGSSNLSGRDLIATIRTVKINMSLLTALPGAGPGERAQASFSATARLDQ